ncbi:MAG: MBOAT family protein [Lachnospiraceae bacterium]|nr:MBOAT family protein [Lachnospiraceae bacterium]
MLFNSGTFLLFFPIVALVYFIIPKKVRWVWLLISSYYFYMSWNAAYALLLFLSTFITWVTGLLVDTSSGAKTGTSTDGTYLTSADGKDTTSVDGKDTTFADGKALNSVAGKSLKHGKAGKGASDTKNSPVVKKTKDGFDRRKLILAIGVILNLSILGYFKYFNFILQNVFGIGSKLGLSLQIPQFDIVLPVGISFYTFQALGYAIDVYRGDTKAEKNFFRYALFVSFFPQLVAGPIERSKNLLKQIKSDTVFSFDNLRRGFLMTLAGYFLKVVMADNIAIVVDTVFSDAQTYKGFYVVLATVLFAFQIYGDFGGYSLIARGVAKMLGFELMENFNAPYMSRSVTEFWHRWHISLSQWFRDYLYIPLGGNRKGTLRKYINVMIVFLVSGLWHGASWNFVIWGGLNGIFQVFEGLTVKFFTNVRSRLHIDDSRLGYKIFKVIITFILVDFTWLFFRAGSGAMAVAMIKDVFANFNPWILFGEDIYALGLAQKPFMAMVYSILAVLVTDIFKVRGVNLYEVVERQQYVFRLVVYLIILAAILTFGAWGGGYNENTFLYFQF